MSLKSQMAVLGGEKEQESFAVEILNLASSSSQF